MPRLNNQRYYQRHLLLRKIWQQQQPRFALLSHQQQWDIHAYYKPSEQLADAELVKHRQISAEQPAKDRAHSVGG